MPGMKHGTAFPCSKGIMEQMLEPSTKISEPTQEPNVTVHVKMTVLAFILAVFPPKSRA